MKGEELQKFLDDVLAVLVLYRRELPATETFTSLSRNLKSMGCFLDLFVYDNSPTPMAAGEEGPHWRIHHRHDLTNPGVSKAYNEGAKLARQLGKKWLLLLDQDTVFPEHALASYSQAVVENPEVGIFAPVLKAGDSICSPCRYLARTGFHLKTISVGRQRLQGKAVLNSGMLVSVDIFERCGGFDDRIQLDFADFAFNNRLRHHIDTFYLLPFQCSHGFSGTEEASLDSALIRFELFCEGAANSINGFADAMLYRLVVLKRCLWLTISYRSFHFLASSWRFILKGSESQ